MLRKFKHVTWYLVWVACIWMSSTVLAQPTPQGAVALVEQTVQRSVDAVRVHQDEIKTDPRIGYQLIRDILAPHVDFELIARLVLAQQWKQATPEQRQRFVDAFRESLLRTYSLVLSDNIEDVMQRVNRQQKLLQVQSPPRPQGNDRVIVETILLLNGQPITMDYRMHARDGEWQVYDVVIENVSFVTNYRVEFASMLRNTPLEKVIADLEKHNADAWDKHNSAGHPSS